MAPLTLTIQKQAANRVLRPTAATQSRDSGRTSALPSSTRPIGAERNRVLAGFAEGMRSAATPSQGGGEGSGPSEWPEGRRLFEAVLDTLDTCILVLDVNTGSMYMNPALRSLETCGPGTTCVHADIREFVEHFCRGAGQEEAECGTTDGCYLIRGNAVRAPDGSLALMIVTVEPIAQVGRTDQDLQAEYGLSAQEVRVARLIARGSTNAEIAKAMFISPHTARHHTERILRKLGAKCRAQVGNRLLRSSTSPRA
jgi:DNA-binding CsgD family transcriptional regulator